MADKIRNSLYLTAGMSFIPAVLYGSHAITGATFADILMTTSIYVIFYPALLALVATWCGHFRPIHAVYPILLMPLADLAIAPALGWLFRDVFPTITNDVLGKSLLVTLGPIVAGMAMLHRATLFRFMTFGLGLAQCVALVLFHIVAVSGPMEGMTEQERLMVQSTVQLDGNFNRLCEIEGRECFDGDLAGAEEWANSNLRKPFEATSLIEDTSDIDQLDYTWFESPTPSDLHAFSIISIRKTSQDAISIMVYKDGPTVLYHELVTSLGILIAVFHEVWVLLTLSILARHGSYSYRNFRWRRDQ